MDFVKMHGLGNDYVFVDCFRQSPPRDPASLSVRVSDRHRGVGSDGLILVEPSEIADARMRIFNADGSEAEICGNGLRCVARLLREYGLAEKDDIRVETKAGVRETQLLADGRVRADMGEASYAPETRKLEVCGETLFATDVSMGNPHAVIFMPLPDDERFVTLGRAIERHPDTPQRTNVEFCERRGEALHVRVWERGSGETMACGSGACAVLVAAHLRGVCGRSAEVVLPGGALRIEWSEDGRVLMTGPAQIVFAGTWPDE